jgi:hypothetical protein
LLPINQSKSFIVLVFVTFVAISISITEEDADKLVIEMTQSSFSIDNSAVLEYTAVVHAFNYVMFTWHRELIFENSQ